MSSSSDLVEKTERALKAHGLDLCEYYVLCTAYGESPAPRKVFAAFSKEGVEGDPRGDFPLAEYEAALARLLARGLLVTIEPADLPRGEVRIGPGPRYELDDVCFSEQGYRVYAELIREIFGRAIKNPFSGPKRRVPGQ